ncbi:MAG: hypothetical protein ACYC8T_11740 [Myxococcaceae bacterium]
MLALLLALSLAQAAPKAVVIDVSAPDAVYEDVSRALAERVVGALKSAGFEAVRIDESELPEQGCRIGPCLGVVARARKAQVVVIVDATEQEKGGVGVNVAALWAADGRPLAATRFSVDGKGTKPAKALERFGAQLLAAVRPLHKPGDGG